jgi:hypothetical protein
MLESVDVGKRAVADYEATAGPEVIERLRTLAEPLRGARILHLNATPYGGGVAEILRSEIPLLRDLGIAADWKIITGDKASSRLRRRCTTPYRAIGARLRTTRRRSTLPTPPATPTSSMRSTT